MTITPTQVMTEAKMTTFATRLAKYEVSLSSICNEVTKIILNLFIFIFFHKKSLSVKKAPNAKQATFTPLEVCARKILLPSLFFCSLIFVLLVGFLFVSVFVRLKSFLKKIK